jgi:D-psicose/D-tagatose/L-ribulose 3-epimerase
VAGLGVLKFACSNLAWPREQEPQALQLLRRHGVTGVEIAPTRIWPVLQDATVRAAREEAARLADGGFTVPAMQALLYGEPGASLFNEEGRPAFIRRLTQIASLAGALGSRVAVLGAPGARDPGEREPLQAREDAASVLRGLAAIFADQGAVLCIEPVPTLYGCRFVNTARQALDLVRAIDHPGFGLHLDAAALHMASESLPELWPELGEGLQHFHLSEPGLGNFHEPKAPHSANLRWLSDHSYEGYVSVEMLEPAETLSNAGPWSLLKSYVRYRSKSG